MRREVECACGHQLQADDDDELFVALRAHSDVAHAETTDDEIRQLIKENAHDV